MKDCIDILKENMMKLTTSEEQRTELQEIFSKEIEIPPTGTFDVNKADDDFITLEDLIENYFTEEDKKDIKFSE